MNLEALHLHVKTPDPEVLRRAVVAAKAGAAEGREALCGSLIWTAFAAPAAATWVYDSVSNGWLDADLPATWSAFPEAPLPEAFWRDFGAAVAGATQGYDAASITATVAALDGVVDERFRPLAELAAAEHPGVTEAADREIPSLLEPEELAACSAGSLARELHALLVSRGFDAEVLDRESIGLRELPPTLRYVNTRILQMHDIWHLVAGYETTALHEIAISAFQLAQFGHNYSAMFLATVATISHSMAPASFPLLLENICEGWTHGRSTPSFMDIAWEREWHQSIAEIRARHGIEPFQGSFPADLLENLSSA